MPQQQLNASDDEREPSRQEQRDTVVSAMRHVGPAIAAPRAAPAQQTP
jgi:hypothetical protein